MAYCGPRGIALDDFLAWSQHSQDAALVWSAHESRRCPGCGTHPEDWDPAKGGSRDARHWHPEVCVGCQRKQAADADLRKDKDPTRGLGLASAPGGPSSCPTCNPSL